MRFDRHTILPLLAFLAPVVLMGLLSVHTLTSIYQDIGRHITVGRIVWQTWDIPTTNLFSYTVPDFPFVNHHWFAGALLYLGERAVGLGGLIVIKAFLVAGAFALASGAAWRQRLALPGMVIGLASAFVLAERTDVRPEVLSFLFLAWFLFVLWRYPHSRLVWTLPFIQLLWVNTHIYFFMGPLVVLAWWVGEYMRSGSSALSGRRHWLLVGTVALATLINPSGWHGAVYPLTMWGNYGYSVMENQSPFFLRAWGYPMWTSWALGFTMVLTAISFILNRRHLRRNIDGVLLAFAGAVFALMMVRNFPLFALIALPVALRNLDEFGWRFSPRSWLTGALVISALLGISIVTNQVYDQAGLPSKRFGIIVPAGHQASVDFFRSAGLKGPVFNNFDIGSFLIWKLPEEKVFIDGRPEAYPAQFIRGTYIAMQEDAAVWRAKADGYGINTVFWNEYDITPWSEAFERRILADPGWVLVYRADGIMMLVRNASQNVDAVERYRRK